MGILSTFLKRHRFYLLHCFSLFLLLSLFAFPAGKALWARLDEKTFLFLNSAITGRPLQELFWALANIKITDLYGATFFLLSFLLYVSEGKTKEIRRLRLGYMIYTLLWFEISILFAKQVLTPLCEALNISRHSPTIVVSDAVHFSSFCPWAKIKDVSHFCFPADHALIVFQWCLFFSYFAGFSRGLLVSSFSLFFLLPRLISGAHWLSDTLVGSVSIILVAFAWAMTPKVYEFSMDIIQKKIIRLPSWRCLERDNL